MKNSQIKFYHILRPFSFFYEIGVRVRNLLFDRHLISSQQYSIPVICVGNLAAGGTGKTPLVEYLIRMLSKKYRVAMLSRGYKRKTSGYVLANQKSTSSDIGDEAYQIKYKYPQVIVVVDKNRRRGIQNLLAMSEDVRPQVVLLDDAFQHRYIQPSYSILVTDFNRPYYEDKLLPVGRLREPIGAVLRADMVMVSKCDRNLKPIDCRIIENEMDLTPHQPLFFTDISYQQMEAVYSKDCYSRSLDSIQKEDEVFLLTGIADPTLLIEKIKKYSDKVKVMNFNDHHFFNKKDVKKIQAELLKMDTENPLIICTEKDAARIRNNPNFPVEWRTHLYYLPIMIDFLFDKEGLFDEIILRHITLIENSSILRR